MQAAKGGITFNETKWEVSYAEGLQLIWAHKAVSGENPRAVVKMEASTAMANTFSELF